MKLTRKLCSIVLLWGLVVIVFTLLLLQPGDVDIRTVVEGEHIYAQTTYTLHWDMYRNNIKRFSEQLIENKGLGQTAIREDVSEVVFRHMARSIIPIALAFFLSVLFGILKGIYDYKQSKNRVSFFGKWFTWLFQSIPDFMLIIGVTWILLLMMRSGFPQLRIYGYDEWYFMILPTIILMIYPTMYIAKITASKLEEEESQLYIQTAKAKGLTQNNILYKHMLRNCLATILSHLPIITMTILSNLVVVEYLLYYKGAAYRLLEAFGYANTEAPLSNQIDVNLALGLALGFMGIMLLAHIISQIAKHYSVPKGDVS